MAEKRKRRTPAEIAVDAVETEARKHARLVAQRDTLQAEADRVSAETEASLGRLKWLQNHPDLPEGYALPEDLGDDEDDDTLALDVEADV